MDANLSDFYVAVESRGALERRDYRAWRQESFVFDSSYRALEFICSQGSPDNRRPRIESPSGKRASIPRPDRMIQAAPAFGLRSSDKRTLGLATDHPMIPREHLSRWLGVSDGRISQMMQSLIDTWGMVERHGGRGDTRYTLSAGGIRYVTLRLSHRDPGVTVQRHLPTSPGWNT